MAGVLKSLTFGVLPKAGSNDPIAQRRHKLIERLQQQIALANDPNYKIPRQKWVKLTDGTKELRDQPKKVTAWWRGIEGNVVLTVRYGAQPISFEKGKAAILVGKKDKLVQTLEALVSATAAGELDGLLEETSRVAVQTKGKKAA